MSLNLKKAKSILKKPKEPLDWKEWLAMSREIISDVKICSFNKNTESTSIRKPKYYRLNKKKVGDFGWV